MTGRRVLILCTSAKNPFLEAWVAAVEASGAVVAVLVDTAGTRETEVPARIAARTVLLPAPRPSGWRARVEALLDGPPEIVFDWWGIGALAEPLVGRAWPAAPHVLCVDTFPNASRLRAEARDVVRANLLLHRADGLVHASRQMARAVAAATGGRSARLPSAVVYSPFPLESHRRTSAPRAPGGLRLCFTGRSDHLYSSDPAMSKDAVGPYLERFLRLGAEVHVLQPDGEDANRLLDRGYRFYPTSPREALLDGRFADVVGGFDGHLVTYAQRARTARRRVRSSLSTRFATGLCADAPLVAPRSAMFVDEIFARSPIGFRTDDPSEVLTRLEADGAAMRAAWWSDHERWTAEAAGPALAGLWEEVLERRSAHGRDRSVRGRV